MFACVETWTSISGQMRLTSAMRPQSWMMKASAPRHQARLITESTFGISAVRITMFTVT